MKTKETWGHKMQAASQGQKVFSWEEDLQEFFSSYRIFKWQIPRPKTLDKDPSKTKSTFLLDELFFQQFRP